MSLEQEARRELFDRKALARLLVPLLIEQLLALTIGMADTVMVSSLGEAAVSAVSLVDGINVLLLSILSAMATGGAVVASQYLGHRDEQQACNSARQLYQLTFLGALAVAVVCLTFNRALLRGIFGHVEEAVLDGAVIYFALTALSYPFMALYNSGAALFRSMGNSKVSMYISLVMNLANIGGNALMIFGFHWGVAGAGAATLLSRIVGAVAVTWLLMDRHHPIHLHKLHKISFQKDMVGRILRVGVPNGLENGMFQVGKLLVLNLTSSFGTAAIAANAICNTVAGVAVLPGSTVGLAMVTVVGQCMGAGDSEQADRGIRRLMLLTHGAMLVTGLGVALLNGPLVDIFNLSGEAAAMARSVLRMYGLTSLVFWPTSFTLPCGLRGAGDARFTMLVSVGSMWACRIGLSYLLGGYMGMGLMGVWIAMSLDWVMRDAFYLPRWLSGKWKTMKVI